MSSSTSGSLDQYGSSSIQTKITNVYNGSFGKYPLLTTIYIVVITLLVIYFFFKKCKESLSNPTAFLKFQQNAFERLSNPNVVDRSGSVFAQTTQNTDTIDYNALNCDGVSRTDGNTDAHDYLVSTSKETAVGTRNGTSGKLNENQLSKIMAGN